MKLRVRIFLASMAGLALIGCSNQVPRHMREEQPTTIVEPVGARPHYHWRQGGWKWSRKHQTYVWEQGDWVNRRKHTKWVEGHWVKTGRGLMYMEGHWQ